MTDKKKKLKPTDLPLDVRVEMPALPIQNDRASTFTDQFDAAIAVANGGINLDTASETVQDTLLALRKQAKAMLASDYAGDKDKTVSCPECKCSFSVKVSAVMDLSKTMANTAKVIDETARLIQYTNGKPDSRPEVVGANWLQGLTDEQLAIVQGWMAGQEAR
jgi:hypothetical protein